MVEQPNGTRLGKRAPGCSFCCNSYENVGPLAGSRGQWYICLDCVQSCASLFGRQTSSVAEEGDHARNLRLRDRNGVRCSFCGGDYHSVGALAEGPGDAYICRSCLQLCAKVIEAEIRRLAKPLGACGIRPAIRHVVSRELNPKDILAQLAQGGTEYGPPGYSGTGHVVPGGGWVGLRPSPLSGHPTLDVNIPGISIDKITFKSKPDLSDLAVGSPQRDYQLKEKGKLTSESLAAVIIDAMLDAAIVDKENAEKAIAIAVEEITARKAAGDY